MLGFLKKDKTFYVYAPMSGTVQELEQVPDEAFRDKLLGDGMAVLPEKGDIYAPVDGVITDVTDTKHAFCITAKNGAEILLHVGINTVNLKGEGFEVIVKEGDKISVGDKLGKVNLSYVHQYGLPIITPILLTEPEEYELVETAFGTVIGGEDVLYTYKKR